MYMRAITIRIAYVAILSAGIVFAAALRDSNVHAAPAAVDAAQAAASVPGSLSIVTLPAVHVRAAAAPVRAQVTEPPTVALASTRAAARGDGDVEPRGGGSLPSLRLDMPYYSFGRLLPRVGKE